MKPTKKKRESNVNFLEPTEVENYRKFYEPCREELAPFLEWIETNGPPSEEALESLSDHELAMMRCAILLNSLRMDAQQSGDDSIRSEFHTSKLKICEQVEAILEEMNFISPLGIRRKLQDVLGGEIHV